MTMTEDVLGRKYVLVFSGIFIFIGGICVLFLKNYVAKVFGIILFWVLIDLIYVTLFIFYLELSVKEFRNKSSTIFSIFYFLGGILGNTMTIYFAHYKAIILTTFFSYLLIIVGVFFLIPRSPYLMLKIKKFQDLRKSLIKIMAVNRCSPEQQAKAEESLKTIVESISLLSF